MLEALEIRPFQPEDSLESVAEVMSRAFERYPVPVRAFASAPGDIKDWIRQLFGQAIRNRLALNVPVLVAYSGAEPVGVAVLNHPDHESTPELRAKMDAIAERAGPATKEFFTRFMAAVDSVAVPERALGIGMLAVDPPHQGQGVGRQLIEAVVQIAETIPGCPGVELDTEEDKNVRIYGACGFQLLGQAAVDDMPVFVMFRSI